MKNYGLSQEEPLVGSGGKKYKYNEKSLIRRTYQPIPNTHLMLSISERWDTKYSND